MAGLNRLSVVAPSLARRLLGLGFRRGYGSASAAQVQYDYYDSEEEEEWGHGDRRQAKPLVDSEGFVPGRGVQWVVIGDRTAKKHVYAERLSKLLQVPHISMGTLVRQELNPRSSLYKQIANAVNEGKLVPEEIIFPLLSKRLEEGYCRGETGFILDGIPRTSIQAEILDQIADIDLVVNFKSTGEHLEKKNLGTGNFTPCQEYMGKRNATGYNLNLYSQNGQQVSTTTDSDSEVLWKEKFSNYAEQSKSLEDYYKTQRKLVDIQVTDAPGETWQGLLAALHLQHINAVSSSQKLTA
ncbi:probable adenylate kinase 7, mitochondrial [Humulus lupulus]|uniref:probable adenylate kinase 7, mitochondrial n=1 Tax=Humulus lupulus TaxID=3486 RepID=UPI002B41079E|nr:probable adenylate kinase 7, mitochondrial [Humulus lupulus]